MFWSVSVFMCVVGLLFLHECVCLMQRFNYIFRFVLDRYMAENIQTTICDC